MLPEDQKRILGYFIEEAKDHLNTIEQGLLNLQATIEDAEMVNEVFRAAHSVKGGAAMLGLESIQRTAHRMEDYFKILKEAPVQADRTLESMLLQIFDGLQEQLDQLQGPFGLTDDKAQEIMTNLDPLFGQVEAHLEKLPQVAPKAAPAAAAATPKPVYGAPAAAHPETSALQLVFRSDVPAHLRAMLGLFKQADTPASRQELAAICQKLNAIGEQFELANWCMLINATSQVINNEQQTYRTLAPLVIKEIKQAQDLVISGRAFDIRVSQDMMALVPVIEESSLDSLLEEALSESEGEPDLAALFGEAETDDALFSTDNADEWLAEVTEPIAAEIPETDLTTAFEDLESSGSQFEETILAPRSGVGPEVGAAELNSLADLFEGEVSELNDVWEEEEIAESTADLSDGNSLDAEISDEFADLLLDDSTESPTPSEAADDLASLFGTALSSEDELTGEFPEDADLTEAASVDWDGSDLSDPEAMQDAILPEMEPAVDVTEAPDATPDGNLSADDWAAADLDGLNPADMDDASELAPGDDANELDSFFETPAETSASSEDANLADIDAFFDSSAEDRVDSTEESSSAEAAAKAPDEADLDVMADLWEDTLPETASLAVMADEPDTISSGEPTGVEPEGLGDLWGDSAVADELGDLGLVGDAPSSPEAESVTGSFDLDELGQTTDGAESAADDMLGLMDLDSDLLGEDLEGESLAFDLDDLGTDDNGNVAHESEGALDLSFDVDYLSQTEEQATELAPELDFDFAADNDTEALDLTLDLDDIEAGTATGEAADPSSPMDLSDEGELTDDLSFEGDLDDLAAEPPDLSLDLAELEDTADLEQSGLDFGDDLDFSEPASSEEQNSVAGDFDFDLDLEEAASPPETDNLAAVDQTAEDFDFDLDLEETDTPSEADNLAAVPPTAEDFDLDLEAAEAGTSIDELTEASPVAEDLDFDLDLSETEDSAVESSLGDLDLLTAEDSAVESSLDFDLDLSDTEGFAAEGALDDLELTDDSESEIDLFAEAEASPEGPSFDESSLEIDDLESATDLNLDGDLAAAFEPSFDLDEIAGLDQDQVADAEPAPDFALADSEPADTGLVESTSDLDWDPGLAVEETGEFNPFDDIASPDLALPEETSEADDSGEASDLDSDLDLDWENTLDLDLGEEASEGEGEANALDENDFGLEADWATTAADSLEGIDEDDAGSDLWGDSADLTEAGVDAESITDLDADSLDLASFALEPDTDGSTLTADDGFADESAAQIPDPFSSPGMPEETAGEVPQDDFAFDELESLLEDEPAGEPFATLEAEADTGFEELEDLLDSEPAPLPIAAEPSLASDHSIDEEDEFEDLEKLLEEADQLGGTSPASSLRRGQSSATRRMMPRRSAAMVDQTMRVSVKHLDTLSNLVGELVVNRNSLEQDQERLRQFLDNLLFQVQQLNDVGQRMRDLYERSLLESSLMSNRQSFQAAGLRTEDPSNHATGVTFDALEMDRFTGFHTLSQEMIELIVRVRESASDIGFTIESSDQVTRQFRQVTTQLQEGLNKARMVPFAQTADRLPRAVRDISLKCGKEAKLSVEGRDTLIDKMILERLYDPMTHLVNNAITHGIETPEERLAAGKSREGTITVRAFYQGNQTVIYLSDDGAGINPDIVKQKALQKGLISPEEAQDMSQIDMYELLFQPGFTTRDQADDFAGRGVGMDVVQTALSEIRGSVTIDSELGKGTSFTIRLPLTLSISKALSCVNNQARVAFPMDGVEDMFDVPRDRIQQNENGQACIPWRETLLPFRPLSDLLQFNRALGRGRVYGGNQDDDIISIVVLRSANTYLALQVDQVIGEQEIVIKQLEGPVPKPMGIAGATVLGDGRVMPIADVLELIDLSMGRVRREPTTSLWAQPEDEVPITEEAPAHAEPTVLIVDDSITVRELLSMSFNKVGYRVEQARDGQEAWEKLRSGLPCDLVFCDIEMPRMDGLELLSRMQKDSALSTVPIAMLTSRGADRHRQMAVDLGASGYFTKPYLEEVLLDAAQRMLNGERLVGDKSAE